MFFTSNLSTNDMGRLLDISSPSSNTASDLPPSHYTLQVPLRLNFTTMQPAEKDHYYTTAFVAPNGCVYGTLNKEELQKKLSKSLHQHDYYELLFVIDGELYQNIENQRHLYTRGSCCMLNKNIRHTEEYNTYFRVVFLQMSEALVQSLYDDLTLDFFHSTHRHDASQLEDFLKVSLANTTDYQKDYIDLIPNAENDYLIQTVHNFFDQLTRELLNPTVDSSLCIKRTLLELLRFLSISQNFNTSPVRIGTEIENQLFEHIQEAMQQSHGRVTRTELSKTLHYSGAYLNEITKKYTGLSLFQYGITFCMHDAAKLLRKTDMDIVDIALSLDFSNRTHFYKLFKEAYGMTPAAYRKKVKRETSIYQ